MSQPIRARGGHLIFPIGPKNTKLVEDFEILLPVKFLWILFSGFIREVKNISANQRLGAAILFFFIGTKNTNLVEDFEILLPIKFCWIRFSGFRGETKMSRPIRGQGCHLVFPMGPKNTNLVEGFEILLPVKFPWIPFGGFRGEVENVSANQRPGRPSCFSDRPEKHKTW